MTVERDFKGIWIPKEIWLDNNLTWSEKMLLVEIDSLATLEKGCIATNEYLSDFFNLSKDRISKLISSLKAKGYIEVKLVYKKGTKQILKREITTIGYRQKQLEGIVNNADRGIGENNEEINTDKINTEDYIKERGEEQEAAESVKEKNNTGMYFQEIRMLLSGYNINFEKIAKFGKPIERIKAVIKFAKENGKGEGWIVGAIKDDYKLEVFKPKAVSTPATIQKDLKYEKDNDTEKLYEILGL